MRSCNKHQRPSVPAGTERLRFTPGPKTTEATMDGLIAALIQILSGESGIVAV
ncbi:MAG TPA: hypothetical protein PK677_07275 [Acidiphilium sp.]|nr:hypothetical protein [Acidiphilium sp.]HQU23393.1 hypothetical protein [Acidiphilium sp.]